MNYQICPKKEQTASAGWLTAVYSLSSQVGTIMCNPSVFILPKIMGLINGEFWFSSKVL